MLDWTYELGFLGFLVRALPSFAILAVGMALHLATAKQVRKGATATGLLALMADKDELTPRGEEARFWCLGAYAAGLVALTLTGLLSGVPDIPTPWDTPAPAAKSDGPPPFAARK